MPPPSALSELFKQVSQASPWVVCALAQNSVAHCVLQTPVVPHAHAISDVRYVLYPCIWLVTQHCWQAAFVAMAWQTASLTAASAPPPPLLEPELEELLLPLPSVGTGQAVVH